MVYEGRGDVESVEVEDVVANVRSMSERLRECHDLVVIGGYTEREAARVVGIDEVVVKRESREKLWREERKIRLKGDKELIKRAVELYGASLEMPVVKMYYELQRECIKRLMELVNKGEVDIGVINGVIEIAHKGLDIAERVIKRCGYGDGVNVGGGVEVNGDRGKGIIQVNVLQRVLDRRDEERD